MHPTIISYFSFPLSMEAQQLPITHFSSLKRATQMQTLQETVSFPRLHMYREVYSKGSLANSSSFSQKFRENKNLMWLSESLELPKIKFFRFLLNLIPRTCSICPLSRYKFLDNLLTEEHHAPQYPVSDSGISLTSQAPAVSYMSFCCVVYPLPFLQSYSSLKKGQSRGLPWWSSG